MNSKHECIAKAYGEYYDLVKDNLTENGFTGSYPYHGEGKDLFIKISHIAKKENWDNNQFHYRPKSLQGIENNNGWIKIESEDSVPRDFENYHVVSKECGVIVGTACKNNKAVIKYWLEHFTHYQPITKPEPPLH